MKRPGVVTVIVIVPVELGFVQTPPDSVASVMSVIGNEYGPLAFESGITTDAGEIIVPLVVDTDTRVPPANEFPLTSLIVRGMVCGGVPQVVRAMEGGKPPNTALCPDNTITSELRTLILVGAGVLGQPAA